MKETEQAIRFTFDIDAAFDRLKNRDFSKVTGTICNLDYDRMITQKDVFDRLPVNVESEGVCVLVSLYNAFPVFDSFDEFMSFLKEMMRIHKKDYAKLSVMTEEINRRKHANLLFSIKKIDEEYRIFVENIKQGKPVVAEYTYNRNIAKALGISSHVVTLVGYNDDYIYYKENSEKNYLFSSLAIYVYMYYKRNGVHPDNPEYNRLSTCMKLTDDSKIWPIMKKILGYNEFDDDIRSLKKAFLTNGEFFNDSQCITIYKPAIEQAVESNTNKFNLSFSFIRDYFENTKFDF